MLPKLSVAKSVWDFSFVDEIQSRLSGSARPSGNWQFQVPPTFVGRLTLICPSRVVQSGDLHHAKSDVW